jgi:hypothetical protein
MLERSIEALSHFLASKTSCDYIGTRLHGGITCLLAKKRSLIVQVDNRTKEIAHDTGLPTANRSDFAYIRRWIEGPTTTQIHLDISTINRWRQHVKTHGHKYSRGSGRFMTVAIPVRLLNILQVNTSDVGGGAEKIAATLHHAYNVQGHNAWMVVGRKYSQDNNIFICLPIGRIAMFLSSNGSVLQSGFPEFTEQEAPDFFVNSVNKGKNCC